MQYATGFRKVLFGMGLEQMHLINTIQTLASLDVFVLAMVLFPEVYLYRDHRLDQCMAGSDLFAFA
jgi:hypothetical protein